MNHWKLNGFPWTMWAASVGLILRSRIDLLVRDAIHDISQIQGPISQLNRSRTELQPVGHGGFATRGPKVAVCDATSETDAPRRPSCHADALRVGATVAAVAAAAAVGVYNAAAAA
eukprot:364805-Chlamydomonas_euryale.AAC.7